MSKPPPDEKHSYSLRSSTKLGGIVPFSCAPNVVPQTPTPLRQLPAASVRTTASARASTLARPEFTAPRLSLSPGAVRPLQLTRSLSPLLTKTSLPTTKEEAAKVHSKLEETKPLDFTAVPVKVESEEQNVSTELFPVAIKPDKSKKKIRSN